MYIKLKNGVIDKYPYSLADLVKDNPDTSFPDKITNECAASFEVYPVTPADYPQVDHTKTVLEETPVKQRTRNENGTYKADELDTPENEAWEWVQVFTIVDATAEEIAARVQELNLITQSNRAEAYRNEADPIFFKAQRGEATQQEWLDKVAEIKARFPKVE